MKKGEVIKSRFTRSNPSSENQNLKPKHGVSTSTPKCKRQLRSFARTQHKGASQQAGHARKRQNPKQRCFYSADCDTQSCSILNFMTLKLPRANVLCLAWEETQFLVQKSRPFLKGRLNNSKRVESQIQLATKFGSTSKSSQIIPVLIQTWITRVLYNQERSRCSIMFCTMFFWVTKLPQTSRSFSNNTWFSQNKVPASRNMMESRKFCSTSHSFQ